MITVVYIGGYGRSGSTLLDTLLHNHPDCTGCGELRWLFHHAAAGTPCSCGQALTQCSFWAPVLADLSLSGEEARVTDQAETTFRLKDEASCYSESWSQALHRIAEQAGTSLLVDSSKTCHNAYHRPLLFHEMPDVRVKMIHLIRDPRAVMWSLMRVVDRRQHAFPWLRKRMKITKGLSSWIWANRAARRIAETVPCLEVHYHELIEDPEKTMEGVARFLDLDPSPLIPKLRNEEAIEQGCAIGGNRMRKSTGITLDGDHEWESKLPRYGHLLYALHRASIKQFGY